MVCGVKPKFLGLLAGGDLIGGGCQGNFASRCRRVAVPGPFEEPRPEALLHGAQATKRGGVVDVRIVSRK